MQFSALTHDYGFVYDVNTCVNMPTMLVASGIVEAAETEEDFDLHAPETRAYLQESDKEPSSVQV